MKTKYNKLSLFNEQKNELINNENIKFNILKEKIIHERQSVLQRDGELRKISQELQTRIMNYRYNSKKPIQLTSFIINQRQNEPQKVSQENSKFNIKEQQKQQDISKCELSLIGTSDQEIQIDKFHSSKKQLKMKYKDAVKSILIKSIGQSFHEESLHIVNYQQKPKSISINESSNLNNFINYKPIDKYILSQLEDIATDQKDQSQLPTISQSEAKTQKQTKSLFKLLPLTVVSQETQKLKGFKSGDDFQNTKLVPEFKFTKCSKNYEITRKAQERITLYQKILKLQNNRSKSTFIRQSNVNQNNQNQF